MLPVLMSLFANRTPKKLQRSMLSVRYFPEYIDYMFLIFHVGERPDPYYTNSASIIAR